ncbi:hypothetical protein AVEN_75585-1 [Araneus ventricosus]|uniref:Uncharacterized protein n=1 Tax=Araneus ventricosus TaxID=182803 RepID=A0A4Y2CJT0_ARAVE|nr:hypothetical protein AVEN_75585-1 [Araneus ventricosus]
MVIRLCCSMGVKSNDSRCNSSSTEARVLVSITVLGPTPPKGGSVVLGFLRNCDVTECQDFELRRELERIGWVPTTEEQLERFCPPTMTALRCAVATIQECVGKDLVELSTSDNKTAAAFAHGIVATRNLITDICTPGTEMRENYLSSISCFKELMTDAESTRKCQQQGYAVYATYEQSEALLGNEIPVEDKKRETVCMVTAYALACFAVELHDTCGEVARKTFVDTLKRFQFLKRNECTEADINNLKTEFLDFLQLEEQRRSIFSSVFESKKRRK